MGQQAIGGEQKHLEEDEQIEDIARQESTVDPNKLKLEQRMKQLTFRIRPSHGVEQGRKRKQRRQQNHCG